MPESGGPLPLALVTGAARRLGRVLALELARQGYAIGLHYNRSEEQAGAAQAEIEGLGVPAVLLPADLTRPEEIAALFERVADCGHPLRVLVNSAGVMPRGDLRTLEAAAWDATLALNLRAPFLCAQAAVRLMGAAGGLIVNITDSGAHKAWTGYPDYIVSKAGLEALTRLMARAFAPAVRVNAIAPGLFLPSDEVRAEDWERLVKRLPLQRPARPEELAGALAFLLANEYVTGQTIAIDGGYNLA